MNMGGIAGVTTQPDFRRKGQVKKLAVESLKVMRKRKEFISVLYPFKYSYYRKFGYENCADIFWITSLPQNILLPKGFVPLKIKPIPHDKAFDLLMPLREETAKYNLMIFNSYEEWRLHNFRDKDYIYGIYDNKNLVGYFITGLEKREGPWNVRLNLKDHVVLTDAAFLTMLHHIKQHTDQVKDFKLNLYDHVHITDCFDDLWSDSLTIQKSGGPMFRIVDIVESMKLLKFPKELSAIFTLKVKDEMAPWNEGPIKITISKGKVQIEEYSGNDFDLVTDIKAYTQLFIGYRSIYDQLKTNKVEVKKEILGIIDSVFPKQQTRMTSFF